MSYGQTGQAGTLGREAPTIQAAARDNLAEAIQINDRLGRLLERLRAPRPQPVSNNTGIETSNPTPTLEAALSFQASQHRRAHELLTEIESLV